MRINVITLFPELVESVRDHGVVGRALRAGMVDLELTNPRDFSQDVNHRVDDRPYGGGPGMVMQYSPLARTMEHVKSVSAAYKQAKVVYLSPQGQTLDQTAVRYLSQCDNLILLCGRYEGVDERFIEAYVDQEWSIGDYVISGGELAAMVLIDAMVRTLPGALGDDQSAEQESFEHGLLDCPHYTRPEEVDGRAVPEVLLGGDHKKIADWRLKQALGRTYLRRPDMITLESLNDKERQLLDEYLVEVKAKNER